MLSFNFTHSPYTNDLYRLTHIIDVRFIEDMSSHMNDFPRTLQRAYAREYLDKKFTEALGEPDTHDSIWHRGISYDSNFTATFYTCGDEVTEEMISILTILKLTEIA